MKKKIILAALAFVIVICIFATCGETKPDPTTSPTSEPTQTITSTTDPNKTPEPTPTRAPITSFTDNELEDFNVVVKMPEIWQGATTLEKMPPSESTCIGDFGIKFAPKGVMLTRESYIGWILVYELENWNSFTDEQRGAFAKLAEIDGNVYVYQANDMNNYDPGSKAAQIYDELYITQEEAADLLTVSSK